MKMFRATNNANVETRYSALISRLEGEAETAPAQYKRRIFLLSVLGYSYPLVILTMLLASLFGTISVAVYAAAGGAAVAIGLGLKLIAKYLAIPLLVLSYGIVRALWVRLPPPEGREIEPDQVPKLFALCGQLREQLRGPRIHKILLTNEFNAGIVQVPRLGLLGWQRNYLIIGLPLALALSAKEFEAVLAHEYGHLAGSHGHFSAWVYRMRQTWFRLAVALDERSSWGSFLFTPFFKWFAPYYNAYSFVLARADEYEADRCSADVASSRVAADALIEISVRDRALEQKFWPNFWDLANRQLEPPFQPYGAMGGFFKKPQDPEFKQESLHEVLKQTTGIEDTHPSFADRVDALGEEPRIPQDFEISAAESLFGQALEPLLAELDQVWTEEYLPQWHERFRQSMDWGRQLAGLRAKASHTTLKEEELWRLANLIEELEGSEEALPTYRALYDAHPEHAGASFAIGRISLEAKEADGLAKLETATALDPEYTTAACNHAYRYHVNLNHIPEAKAWEERARQRDELEWQAKIERDDLKPNDELLPHELEEPELSKLIAELKGVPSLKYVYLQRKKVTYLTENPIYVVIFVAKRRSASGDNEVKIRDRLAAHLTFSEEFFVMRYRSLSRRNRSRLKKDSSALIFEQAIDASDTEGLGPWKFHVSDGIDAYQRDDLNEARTQLEIALQKVELLESEDKDLTGCLDDLAAVHHLLGNYSEAEELRKRVLSIEESSLDLEHEDIIESLSNLARLYEDAGSNEKAESLYRRASTTAKKTLGPRHPGLAIKLLDLARFLRTQGDIKEAASLLEDALEIREKSLGEDHIDNAEVLNELASLYIAEGKNSNAKILYKRALSIQETVLGRAHPDFAATRENYANCSD